MTYLPRTSSALAILGLLIGCGPTVDSGSAESGASGTGEPTTSTGSEPPDGSSTSNDSNDSSTVDGSSSESSSGTDPQDIPPAVCGGECFADAVAAAYDSCQSDLDEYPCDAERPCADASVACDVDGENCVFEAGDSDAYVEAVACAFNAVVDGLPGRYSIRYGQESEDTKLGTLWTALETNVESDGGAQSFFVGTAPFEGGLLVSLGDVDLACVQEQVATLEAPVDFDQAVATVVSLSGAVNACSELCLQVFEGAVQFPSDLACEDDGR